MAPRNSFISDEDALGVKVGQRIRVIPRETASVRGKLIELDANNLVIETSVGYEEVFRRRDIVACRVVSRASVD